MSKRNIAWLYIMIILYITGLFAGSMYQVRLDQQAEMTEYLKAGVSGYEQSFFQSIKAVIFDNIPELIILLISAYLPFGIYITTGIVATRGFMTGFALTCAMRVYGFFGSTLCIGNVISSMLTIPLLICYGLFIHNSSGIGKLRLGVFCFLYLAALLCSDGVLKGFCSSLATKLMQ